MINIDMNIDPNLQGILDGGFDKRIQMLPIDCFVYNDLNGDFDSIDDILLFAEEIYEQGGLKDPIHAYRRSEDNKYVILGGHKRIKACRMNLKHHKDAQTMIPTIVEPKPDDWVDEMLIIEELNQHRTYNDDQMLERTEKLLKVYKELERRNKRPQGEKRVWVARKLNTGIKKAERYIHIVEGRYSRDQTKLTRKKENLFREFEDVRVHMQHKLGTKVKITQKTIVLSYTDVDDFNRLMELIGCGNVVNE